MSGLLGIKPLSAEMAGVWDAFALTADEAWFWQTSIWSAWAEAIADGAFVASRSFAVMGPRDILAVCPVHIEEREGVRVFGFLGGPLPSPAVKAGLLPAEREQILGLYVETLTAIAATDRVEYGSVKMPFTAALLPSHSPVNPWLRFGYFDLPYLTQVIDLRPAESALWSDMRKGHRSDIRRASQRASVTIWSGAELTAAKYAEYQALHAKDAGRVTRSQKTFDLMADWIRRDHAVLAETTIDGRAAAFAIIIYYKHGAFYASACRDPDLTEVPASHLLQWEVMRWLKQHGVELYDIGMQVTGPQWFYVPDSKEVSIAAFKRGFGGKTVPLVTAERFYTGEAMARTFDARVRTYLQATAGVVAER
jgi:hypothetical protein